MTTWYCCAARSCVPLAAASCAWMCCCDVASWCTNVPSSCSCAMRSASNGPAESAAAATDSWLASPPASPAAAAAATAPLSCISCCCLMAAAAATCCPSASSCCSGGSVAHLCVASSAAAAVPPPPAPSSAAAIAVAPASTCACCTAAARSRTPFARSKRASRGTAAFASASSHSRFANCVFASISATFARRDFASATASRHFLCVSKTWTSKSSSSGRPRNEIDSRSASPSVASEARRVRWMCLCVVSGLLISKTSPSGALARHAGHT
mmetsp:Transcript_11448/g.48827  ORF Transcript_11448/g.48827 Transcript_11448/m.48827 type:complete len:269 (-) Transcript_11448:589-1395(-)